ncbi:SlyX family protein [Mesorhizobium sp. J428]|uniref:SlyX family protein n=1 Tax=Mesorhizobium sp. J428 TaxID=2898440 RepID=UPI002150C9D8|nr:SlyX family protein [Mesorhizobium sp. J428]MCR5857752.1 SlyX family protein [Mesorhizobium sp. J428]
MSREKDERLTSLEVLAAEQERTIQELSAEIGKAWKTIDDLTRRLDAMSLRLTGLEEATAPEIPVTRPPHW